MNIAKVATGMHRMITKSTRKSIITEDGIMYDLITLKINSILNVEFYTSSLNTSCGQLRLAESVSLTHKSRAARCPDSSPCVVGQYSLGGISQNQMISRRLLPFLFFFSFLLFFHCTVDGGRRGGVTCYGRIRKGLPLHNYLTSRWRVKCNTAVFISGTCQMYHNSPLSSRFSREHPVIHIQERRRIGNFRILSSFSAETSDLMQWQTDKRYLCA